MGGSFGVGCGWFFFGSLSREETGKRQRQGTYNRVVFAGRHAFVKQPHFLFYMLYLEQCGFHCSMSLSQTIANDAPDLRGPGQTRATFKFRQPDDLFHTLKTVKGCFTSFRHGR